MKANAPKRKVFQDAVDLLGMPETVNAPAFSGTTLISIEKIVPFHNHPFRLYEGKRLDDMVESVREHGILIPVIVQKVAEGYEMLAGHNRWNAAKIVGIKDIPAIIRENLTEREAYVYVIETNMLQRSFDELLPSEKAAVLPEKWYRVRKTWADAKSQKRAYKVLKNAKACAEKNEGYSVYDWNGNVVYAPSKSSEPEQKKVSYRVRVGIKNLNIRRGPGTHFAKTGAYTGVAVFTIVAEADGEGATKWGKLKSDAGWISLEYGERIS